ncbi:MAG: TIGR03936 family radical SAM-associated protein [Christensenellaceae bacterium]|jgi:radical SAM-linked protein
MKRVGVKFTRDGFAKFVSHLDMQRMFARTLRRAQLPVKYSEGFNPHINLSFAAPLSVGMETMGDYMEFFLTEEKNLDQAKAQMIEALPPFFGITAVGEMAEKEKKLMALTAAADYRLLVEDAAFSAWIETLLAQESHIVTQERKGKKREVDLRPRILTADIGKQEIKLRVKLGDNMTLNPLLLLETYEAEKETKVNPYRLQRDEIYMEREGAFLPLETLFRML